MAYKTTSKTTSTSWSSGPASAAAAPLWKLGQILGAEQEDSLLPRRPNIDRSGAVTQGLYAINCYMGTRWGENKPEDHVRYTHIK